MIIHHDPDEWVSVSDSHACDFHVANPGVSYAGCTCSSSYGQRRATPEEYAAAKAKREALRCSTCASLARGGGAEAAS